jgi:hypothetical protein
MLLKHDIAGDPMTELKWTHKTPQKLAELLQQHGIAVCANTVARLLYSMDYSLRVNHKCLANSAPERNQQFEFISHLRGRFERKSLPIISVDSKKKEQVGKFKNPGRKWDQQAERVNDHDFRSLASGIAIPYGVYDLLANRGSVFVGISHDTPAFAAHSIAGWWQQEGARRYRHAGKLLILADSGGSNGYRCRAWKMELQTKLANRFGLTLTVAHYPAGTSKWNPIEHRLFSEISKNWAAEPLDSYDKILNFIRTTKTNTGLTVSAYLDSNVYRTGITPDEETLRQLRLRHHNTLPELNYTISPKM